MLTPADLVDPFGGVANIFPRLLPSLIETGQFIVINPGLVLEELD
jgi:hypothetical protein